MVRCLVGKYGATVGQVANDGFFPSINVSTNKHLDVLRYLVDHRADVNQATDEDGHTYLFEACVAGSIDVVKCLVEALHADVNKEDKYDFTPMHGAAIFGHVGVVRCLMSAGANNTNANLVHKGRLEMVRCLVQEFGAIVNERDKDGYTFLISAAKNNDVGMVRCLVDLDADVSQRDEFVSSLTAADVAAVLGHTDVLRFLIASGADGTTAMVAAVANGHAGTVRFLAKEFGTDINQEMQPAYKAPLLYAAKEGNLNKEGNWDMVRCLVELRADVNQRNEMVTRPSTLLLHLGTRMCCAS
jgi:ankyrin repeat protein